jgi:transcriptional regulator with GAF, ATPase, and Fis domain
MKQTEGNEHLLEVISEQEAEIRQLTHKLQQANNLAARREVQARALQVLGSQLLGLSDSKNVPTLLVNVLVTQLGWDTGWMIHLDGHEVTILANAQATQKQIAHVQDYLGRSEVFLQAYAHKKVVSTLDSKNPDLLALRVLFQTDEVVAVPVLSGEHVYGYLVACAHSTKRSGTSEDSVFIPILATLAGQVVKK